MVEYVYPDGRTGWRVSCDARKFCEIGLGVQEAPPPEKKRDTKYAACEPSCPMTPYVSS